MATATGRGDKVAFLKDLLGRKPEVDHKDAGRAWQEAGHEGTISGTSFYRVKSDLGLPGKGQSVGGDAAGKSAPKKAKKAHRRARRRGVLRLAAGSRCRWTTGRRWLMSPRRRPRRPEFGDRERELDQADAHIDDLFFLLKTQGGRRGPRPPPRASGARRPGAVAVGPPQPDAHLHRLPQQAGPAVGPGQRHGVDRPPVGVLHEVPLPPGPGDELPGPEPHPPEPLVVRLDDEDDRARGLEDAAGFGRGRPSSGRAIPPP